MGEKKVENENLVSASKPPAENGGLSFKGLIEVFYKPTAFFGRLKDNPKTMVPYLVLFILVFVFMLLAADLLLEMQMQSPQMQERLQGQEPPPNIKTLIKWNIIGGGTITFLVVPLLAALLALFWGNFVFAGKARFKQLLSIMLYGEVLYAVGNFVDLPLMLAKNSVMAGLSLGALASSMGPESPLFVLLSKFSVFLIWEIIVVGIALSIIYNVSRNKGVVMAVLSVGMLSIIHVIWTAIASMIF